MNAPQLPKIIDTKSGRYIIFSEKDEISQHLITNGIWEENTQAILDALLAKREGDFLDIGANMGAITIPLARKNPARKFYCFEAQRQVYQQLCGNAVLNGTTNVYPYHIAIGNPQDDGQTIQVPVPDYFRDTNIGSITLDERVNIANEWVYDGHEAVSILKADDLGLTNLAVVKIDVEGMEFDVLQGMQDTLERCNYPSILFEIWPEGRYEWVQAEQSKIVSFLQGMNYRVDLFQRMNTGLAQHNNAPQIDIRID